MAIQILFVHQNLEMSGKMVLGIQLHGIQCNYMTYKNDEPTINCNFYVGIQLMCLL
jgi:hypothetical protein